MKNKQIDNLKFLSYCLDTRPIGKSFVNKIDLDSFFQFCDEQAILGIGLQGIGKIKNEYGNAWEISSELLLNWIGIAEQIKYQNTLLNKRTIELTGYFKKQGKKSCILKGQGNALMYPDPLLRTSGDIDVWINGSKKEIAEFVHKFFPDMNVQYHHMNFPFFKDTEVEIHYYPSFCYNKWNNAKLLGFFKRESDIQFSNMSEIGFCVPTNKFNLVFQLSHMMRHFFTQGIGLRHAIDYYYLLKQEITRSDCNDAIAVMKQCGMFKFFCSILWIEKEILGLDIKDIADPNEKAGRLILREMLKGGNFGKQNQHICSNIVLSYAKQMGYNMQYVFEFPSETLSRPFTLIWDYIVKKIRNL